MNNFTPFQILHIDLSQQINLIPPAINNSGSYLIFWWKEIPIGELSFEANQLISTRAYHIKIIDAILPTINFYANKTNFNFDWSQFLLANKFPLWKIKMEILFSSYITAPIPKSVPVSVIICTRNRATFLYQCLTALNESLSLAQEIIVVDNASNNNETEEIVKQFPEIIYVKESKIGLDMARNTGIKRASCEIVAFTDDDVKVHSLWAYRVWETFQNSSIAAMTGLVFASALDTEAQFIFEKYWSFNRGYINKIYDKTYFSSFLPKGAPVWEIGAGANMAFRKSLFEEVGYFHELLDVGAAGCNGDSEMWFRILAKGENIQYNPRAVAFHSHRSNMKELKKQIFNYMRGSTTALLWQQKQKPDAGYKRNILLMLLSYTIMLVKGFPGYSNRYKTIWTEVRGVISGFVFFLRKRKCSSFSVKK